MKGGAWKDNGGAREGAGRKPCEVPTEPVQVKLTAPQRAEFKHLGGSGWLQGAMNLQLAGRTDALALLFLSGLVEKHGRQWLQDWLDGKSEQKGESNAI